MVQISIEQIKPKFSQLNHIEELKTGGQKAVYKANHSEFGDIVLKIVTHDGNDPRILREIELIQKHSFPNVPQIYESGTIEFEGISYIYIYEQLVTGSDLRTTMELKEKFSLSEVLTFLHALLETVVALETKNIVHRDIKPDNILFDNQNKYWLIDFGIARDLNDVSLTATSANFGPHTAGYAPPEQYRNFKRLIDSRADLFSIGVVAYEMLHGFNPFTQDANSVIDVYLKTETLTENPLVIPGDTNNELSAFIQTLMQKNHTYRPPSAAMAFTWFSEIYNNLSRTEEK